MATKRGRMVIAERPSLLSIGNIPWQRTL